AVTGQPIPQAEVEFFGWKQVQVAPNRNEYRVDTTAFTQPTDRDGQILLGPDRLTTGFNWLITARKAKDGSKGADRFAYLGFTNVWYNRRHDADYNATRVFTITDRPVYRPEQTVQFKAWVRHAKYDQDDTSDFAGQAFLVRINDPRGQKAFEK